MTTTTGTYRIVFTQRNTMATAFSPGVYVGKGGKVYFLKAVSGDNRSRQHIGYAIIYPKGIEVRTVSGRIVDVAKTRAEAVQMIDKHHRKNNRREYEWTRMTLKEYGAK
jgi:hypothetical protein